jgi:hypothetical protein
MDSGSADGACGIFGGRDEAGGDGIVGEKAGGDGIDGKEKKLGAMELMESAVS